MFEFSVQIQQYQNQYNEIWTVYKLTLLGESPNKLSKSTYRNRLYTPAGLLRLRFM